MGRVRLVTDSTAYLPAETLERLGITVVPLSVTYEGETFREGEGPSFAEFYARLRRGGFPTTSQPSAGDFVEAYRRVAQGCEHIISVHLSAGFSGTVASAQQAAGMLPELDITVVDSLSASAGLGLVVREAAALAAAGAGKDEVMEIIWGMRENMHLLFVVDTLEYLHRGGRIGGAQALFGSLLQVKPILTIKGTIDVFDKVRTKGKAVARAREELEKFLASHPREKVRAAVIHVDAPAEAQALREALDWPGLEVFETGPVLGAHAGPGTVGFAFCTVP